MLIWNEQRITIVEQLLRSKSFPGYIVTQNLDFLWNGLWFAIKETDLSFCTLEKKQFLMRLVVKSIKIFSFSRRIKHHNYIYVMLIGYCKWIINTGKIIVIKTDH